MSQSILGLVVIITIILLICLLIGIFTTNNVVVDISGIFFLISVVTLLVLLCFPIDVSKENYVAKIVAGNEIIYDGKIMKFDSSNRFVTKIWTEDGREITAGKNEITIIKR